MSRAELQAGDLVFFYTPISHVGLYIGGGMMVHARTYGSPVASPASTSAASGSASGWAESDQCDRRPSASICTSAAIRLARVASWRAVCTRQSTA